MGKTFLKETAKLLQEKRRKQRWIRTVISLSLVVAMVTSSLLSHPAITMESDTICGMAEHKHSTECYQKQLICGKQEQPEVPATEEKILNCQMEVHEHNGDCQDAEGQNICGKTAHSHGDDGCYQTVTTPGVEGHSHGEGCYESVLVCQKPEHTHSTSCYPQTEAAPAAETVPVTEAQTAATEAQTQATEAQTQATEAQTPAQTETIPSETAAQTESETEKVTEKETETKWSAQELKASGSDYKITVKAPASAKIPDNAVLKVKELKKDTTPQDYAQYTQLAANKAAQQMAKDILYGRYFDLTIEADGKEIQPSDKVTVTLTYSNAVEAKAEIEVKAVYFGDQTELLNVKTNSNGQTWTEAKVEVKKMTVLAIAGIGIEETEAAEAQSETEAVTEVSSETELETEVGTEASSETELETEVSTEVESETEVETETEVSTEVETETETETETEVETEVAAFANTLTAENDAYKVTVSYDESANLPADVTLSLTNYSENDAEYQAALEAVISAKQGEEGFEADQLQLKALDISILDKDGNELEPESTVSVRIEMKSLPEDWETENLEVHHIVEEHAAAVYAMARSAVRNVSLYADEVASGVAVTYGTAVAEFTTESFSTYTVSWTYVDAKDGNTTAIFEKIYIYDTEGNEINPGKELAISIESMTYLSTIGNTINPTNADKVYQLEKVQYTKNEKKYDVAKINKTTLDCNKSTGKWFLQDWSTDPSKTIISESNSEFDLYFIYSETDDNEVTVTFDANGGSETAPEAQTAKIGSTIILPQYTGTNTNNAKYSFLGWTDTADLESDNAYHHIYQPGSEYVLPLKDITLYAAWADGGKINQTEFYIRIDGKIPTEPGYYNSNDYTSGIEVEGDNIKSIHRWIVDLGQREVIGANAINTVTDNLYSFPEISKVQAAINAKNIGFKVSTTNPEKLIVTSIDNETTNSHYYNVSEDNELYVLWYVQKLQKTGSDYVWHIDGVLLVKDKVNLVYNKNTVDTVSSMPLGYQETRNTVVDVGRSGYKAGPILTPVRTGYTFEGWNTKPDGSGTPYLNADVKQDDEDEEKIAQKIELKEDVTTLYAQWSRGYNRLTVCKTDEDGNTLQGATFTLEEKTDTGWKEVSIGTTDGKGIYTYADVRSQTIYRLTETYAPNGFETRNAFRFKVTTGEKQEILDVFVVNKYGNKIDAPEWLEKDYKQAGASGGSAVISLNIADEQIKRNVVFVKEDLNGAKLSGAEFSLMKDDSTVDVLQTSDSYGIFSKPNATLTYGTYTLTETKAPDGYQITAPITITLNDPTGTAATTDGTYKENTGLALSGNGANYASVSMTRTTSSENNKVTTTYTYTVTVRDRPKASVTVIKTDGSTGDKLAGVTFSLMKQGDNNNYSNVVSEGLTDGKFRIDETNKDTGVTFSLDDGTYKLTEVIAPAGYIIKTADTVFTITKGVIQPLEVNHATLESENTINIKNDAGVALPNTGGSGTQLYTLSGLLLLAVALMYGLVLRRRREGGIYG